MIAVAENRSGTERMGLPAPDADTTKSGKEIDFARLYDTWWSDVVRWVRALGGPDADADDLAQEVFLVVRRKLADFDGRNLAGWLYAISAKTVSDHRRRAWFRRLFMRPRDVELEQFRDERTADPGAAYEQREARERVHRLVGRMSEKRRTAFVLFELEGYSGDEIARLLEVPVATVWTRLHHARKEFLEMVRAEEGRPR